jgi:2-polyprenyl-3-methyl-5-hydroxy-6-metoxy-1,4-benzoquinol methylase
MTLLVDLSVRRREPELMDDPALDPQRHALALRGLRRINHWSRAPGFLWPSIRDLAREHPDRPLRVLDVACGGADNAINLVHLGRRAGLKIQVDACDISRQAIEYARRHADEARAGINFLELNVLEDPIPAGYDALTTSLFLHHLDEADVVRLLQRMAEAAGRMVLVADLLRSTTSYAVAWLGTRVLSTSPIVRTDGPLSVRAAFTIPEVRGLCERAGLAHAIIERRLPCRFLLTWMRP